MVKTFLVGDQKITDASVYLKSCAENYNRALSNFHARVGFTAYELIKGAVLI